MRIDTYLPQERSLLVHDENIRHWLDGPWIKRGEVRYSLRDLTDDPGINHVVGCVFHSTGDPPSPTYAPPVTRGGWVYLNVISADRFLDDYWADWQSDGDEEWLRGSLRSRDLVGEISGPVNRVVFVDLDEHREEALHLGVDLP